MPPKKRVDTRTAQQKEVTKVLKKERPNFDTFLGRTSLSPEEKSYLMKRCWSKVKGEDYEKLWPLDKNAIKKYAAKKAAELKKQRERQQELRDKRREREKLKAKKERERQKKLKA